MYLGIWPRPRALALAALLTVGASACASLSSGGYQDSVARWRLGDRVGAMASATAFYERVREDNGLSQSVVSAAAERALTTLEELPVLTPSSGVRAPLGPADARGDEASALISELRRNLLSSRVTDVMKALSMTRDFGLVDEYAAMLAVIYRREPLMDDGGVLAEASMALRSLAPKWAALRILKALVKGPVNALTPPPSL